MRCVRWSPRRLPAGSRRDRTACVSLLVRGRRASGQRPRWHAGCVLAAGGWRPPLIVVSGRTVPHVEFRLDVELVLLEGSPYHFTSATTWASSGQSCVGKPLPWSGLSLTSSQPD